MNTDTPTTHLGTVAQLLAENGFSTAYVPETEEDPLELLLVTATVMNGFVVPLRLVALNDLITPVGEMAPLAAWLLHASLTFPFHFPAERTNAMLAATQALNRCLPLCSVNISPEEGVCFLQACAPVEDCEQMPRRVILDVIGMARFTAQAFGSPLADLATGAITLDQFMGHVHAAGLTPPPLFNDAAE